MSQDNQVPAEGATLQEDEAELIDRTKINVEPPNIKKLSVRARGRSIEWRAKFRRAMRELCKERGTPSPVPSRLLSAAIRSKGILLVWPGEADDERGFEVYVSKGGRKIMTNLAAAFASMKIELPDGISVDVPVTRYLHGTYGRCLALHFNEAEFLPKSSASAALGKEATP